jgi:hypothetical protein
MSTDRRLCNIENLGDLRLCMPLFKKADRVDAFIISGAAPLACHVIYFNMNYQN